MGTIYHDAVIATVAGYLAHPTRKLLDDTPAMPDVGAFRESLDDCFQPLLVGPIPDAFSDDVTYFFGPDGSKEGWAMSDRGDAVRQQFIDLFAGRYSDGSSPFDVVHVRYGSDAVGEGRESERIVYSSNAETVVAR